MFCKNCGKEIDDNAVICPNCGIQVNEIKSETAASSAKRVNGLGIAAFVVSILSLWLGVYFMIASFVGLGLSIAAFVMRKKYNSCNGLAIAGLVISIVSTAIWVIVWIIVGAAVVSVL